MKERKIRINKSMFLILPLFLLTMLVQVGLAFTDNFTDKQIVTLIWATIVYIFLVYFVYLKKRQVDAFLIFLTLSYFFNYGDHLIIYLFNDNAYHFPLNVSHDSLFVAGYWVLYCIMAICMGYLGVPQNRSGIVNKQCIQNNGIGRKDLRLAAIIILIITCPFYLYNAIQNINATMVYGYGYRIVEASNVVTFTGIMSSFSLSASFAYIVFRNKREKLPFAIILILFASELIAGTRIKVFCYVVCLAYYYLLNHKIRIKNVVLGTVGCYLGISTFSLISQNRKLLACGNMWDKICALVDYILHNNVIIDAVWEMGITFHTSATAIQFCPSDVSHIWGYSYLYSLIYIIPNSLTKFILPVIKFTDEAFASYIVSYGGMGSSYSAEAYYNYGWFGIIPLFLIGILWGILCSLTEQYFRSNRYFEIFVCLEIVQAFILMVRSDMVYQFRSVAWSIFLIYFLSIAIKKLHNRLLDTTGGK